MTPPLIKLTAGQQLLIEDVIGKDNLKWLFQQDLSVLLVFFVSQEGRAALASLLEAARSFASAKQGG